MGDLTTANRVCVALGAFSEVENTGLAKRDFLPVATLPADNIATFVNGVLVDTRINSVDGTGFDHLLGVNKVGFIGESDSKFSPSTDYLFDNVILSTGADAGIVPEPSTYALLVGALALLFVARRRR